MGERAKRKSTWASIGAERASGRTGEQKEHLGERRSTSASVTSVTFEPNFGRRGNKERKGEWGSEKCPLSGIQVIKDFSHDFFKL